MDNFPLITTLWWYGKKKIIDREHEYPFSLTVEIVASLAGKHNPVHTFVRGIGILPSRAMENMNGDYSDWGESKMRGELQHLFKQKENFV